MAVPEGSNAYLMLLPCGCLTIYTLRDTTVLHMRSSVLYPARNKGLDRQLRGDRLKHRALVTYPRRD